MSMITWMLFVPLLSTAAIIVTKDSEGMAKRMALIGSLLTYA